MRVPRVALINLGCRVNRVETDLIAKQLEDAGCSLVDPEQADAIVVNTCAVTGEAQAKTRKAVRHAANLPQEPTVIATGCVAVLFASELTELGSNVVVERDKSTVSRRVLDVLGSKDALRLDKTACAASSTPTPTGRTRPGIKVQDGCDYRCSYCIVWKARGPSTSVPANEVLRSVVESVERGAHEVVLTGINLGRWRSQGDDGLPAGTRLDGLLRHLLERTSIDRIRISSIEPPDVDASLLRLMGSANGRIAPFLHICLQSGCDQTLSRMRRPYNTDLFRRVVEEARSTVPHVAIGTDVIVGFPGETDEEFAQSISFCKAMSFARMHVFRYSRRPGTEAALAKNQIDARTMAVRASLMRDMATESRLSCAQGLDGCRDHVLVQYAGKAVNGQLFDVGVDAGIPVGSWVDVTQSWRGDRLVGEPLRATRA